jgi:hypothetical protein
MRIGWILHSNNTPNKIPVSYTPFSFEMPTVGGCLSDIGDTFSAFEML